MRKILLFVPVLSLAFAIVAAAGATTKPQVNKKPVFDKRFDCGAALPLSYLNSTYASFSWGDGVTLKGAPWNSMYNQDGFRGVSICNYKHGDVNEKGGTLMVVYGSGAASFYKQDHAAATSSGKAVCRSLIAAGRQPNPGQCGPVAVSGLGSVAYEYASYVAVLKGDVAVSFEAGGPKWPNGVPTAGTLQPAMIETVARYVLAHIPQHP